MKRFGTFEGVFTPCLLSILGVIMYLRLGWVVGTVGLTASLVIILLATSITLATGLSMSSVVTNIRIGAGGAHSIIAKSLGVEAGGAIGIPLYLSQAVSVAFYIAGFTECWVSVFPLHPPILVSLCVWLGVLSISYMSAQLAFRLQYGIMVVIALSLVSILLGGSPRAMVSPWSSIGVENFWDAFAIFFPAVTGVLAGAAMSGELKDPKRSIPVGTLSAIGVTTLIYVGLAVWFGYNAGRAELVSNSALLLDLARWRKPVIAGIMGATLSSALSMMVGSPRTLVALGRHAILPFSRSFSRIDPRGEPTTAVLFTALIVLITLLLGTLDSVANLLTMIFLITYGMINLSVFIEQSIGIVSFRPTFRIPRTVSLFGAVGCFVLMFAVNTRFSLLAFIIMGSIYLALLRREMKFHSPDVRSGLLVFLAERFSRAAARLPYHPKIWKPNLLIPVQRLPALADDLPFIKAVLAPSGRSIFFSVLPDGGDADVVAVRQNINRCIEPLRDADFFVETTAIEAPDFVTGGVAVLQTVKEMSFPPNTLFYDLDDDEQKDGEVMLYLKKAVQAGLGILLLKVHPQHRFQKEETVNLWIRRNSPNTDLSILIALQLWKNWDGRVRLMQMIDREQDREAARIYLERLRDVLRMPVEVEIHIATGSFWDNLERAPEADINIFGMPHSPDLPQIRKIFHAVQTSVVFLRDSKHESAIA